jgi:hypothetical protein
MTYSSAVSTRERVMKKRALGAVVLGAIALAGCFPKAPAPSNQAPAQAPVFTPPPPPSPPPLKDGTPLDQTFSGAGDSVVDFVPPANDVVYADITGGAPSSNFIVWTYDPGNNPVDLLVNVLDPYTGSVLVNADGASVAEFVITATGPWTIRVRDIGQAASGNSFSGSGDSVVTTVSPPNSVHITMGGADNNIVWAYDGNGSPLDLLVNEIGPYDGVVPVPNGTMILGIQSSGAWSIG